MEKAQHGKGKADENTVPNGQVSSFTLGIYNLSTKFYAHYRQSQKSLLACILIESRQIYIY